MKRFSKVASGIAAIMLGVGIILCILGAAKQDWGEFGKAWRAGRGQAGNYQAVLGSAEKIYVRIPYGYLKVGVTSEDKILFSAANIEEGSIAAEERGASCYISSNQDSGGFRLFNINLLYPFFGPMADAAASAVEKIEQLDGPESIDGLGNLEDAAFPVYILLLPERIYKEVEVSLGFGLVDVGQIAADRLKAEVHVGEIRTGQADAAMAELVCDVGQIDADGDFEELIVRVDIGKIGLLLPGKEGEYACSASCSIGSIEYGRRGYSAGIRRDVEENGMQTGKKLSLSCAIGGIQVEFQNGR